MTSLVSCMLSQSTRQRKRSRRMPCKDAKMEKEVSATPSSVTNDGQLLPVVRITKPTEFPALVDNRIGRSGDHGGDDSPTTYWYIAPEDGETGEEKSTITVTKGIETTTISVTMNPRTLATLPIVAGQVETVTTTTVTATVVPSNQICTSMGMAVGVPLVAAMSTGALMVGMYILWFWRKDNRRESVATLGEYSDDSSFDSMTPLANPRPVHGGDGGSGGQNPQSGIMAPPSSVASQPARPSTDPVARYGRTLAHRVPQESPNDTQGVRSQRASYVSNYSTIMQPSGSNTEGAPGCGSSLAAALANVANTRDGDERAGSARDLRDGGATVRSDDDYYAHRNSPNLLLRPIQVPYENRDAGIVTRPLRRTSHRLMEVTGRAHPSQRASIVAVPEDEEQDSDIPSASAIPDNQDQANVAKLEGSPVSRHFSAASRARDEGHASTGSCESDAQTLGRDSPFELSADNPIHELGTEGAIAGPANTEQDDGKDSHEEGDAQEGNSKPNFKDGDKAGQGAESSVKQ